MRPISQIPGLDASPASQPGGLKPRVSRSSSLDTSATRNAGSARIEDIVGAAPITSAPLVPSQKTLVADEFWGELRSLILSSRAIPDQVALIEDRLSSSHRVAVVKFVEAGSSGFDNLDRLNGVLPEEHLQSVQETCRVAMAEARTSVFLSPCESLQVFCSPITEDNGCLVFVGPPAVNSTLNTAVEVIAAAMNEAAARRRRFQAETESQHVAALVDLVSRVAEKESLAEALSCAADELKRHLNAEQISIGLCDEVGLTCRLAAVSGQVDIDARSDSTLLTESVLQESIARECVGHWPPGRDEDVHALACHRQHSVAESDANIVSTPLRTDAGTTIGAVVAVFSGGETQQATELTGHASLYFSAVENSLAVAISAVRRSTKSVWTQIGSSIRRALTSNGAATSAAIITLTIGAMLVPFDYTVKCQSELQPVSRRFVAAPFDAPLNECFVEPGDVVEADQVLAELDGRELRWELAGIKADLAKATREHDAFLSEQEFGRAAIARHEMERLQNRSALLSARTQSLEVRSPIAGMVVSGDLKDSEGVPIETGDSLFEVAPLGNMLLEIAIPEDDIRHVATGMKIELTLDAVPAEVFAAEIKRIHPKAELREHENVFIAEAELASQSSWLRPGMRGHAIVSTGAHPLGWNLFHKPVAHVRGWLGW